MNRKTHQSLMNYSYYSWNSLELVHLELLVRERLGTCEAVEEQARLAVEETEI